MNPIVHFEIPAKDMNRAREFYSTLFGWKIEKFKGETAVNENYFSIETTNKPVKLCGGMLPKMQENHFITIYIGVDSVDAFAKKVVELGGKICVNKMAVPKMGFFVCCLDPEGNSFALWEENKNAEPTKEQLDWEKQKSNCSC